jgi:hypothetical protein
MHRKTFFIATAALLTATGAAAQPAPNAPQRARIQVDTNADGSISRAEAQAAAEAHWTRMDANRDGRLDQADWDQIRTQRRAEMFQRLDSDGNGSVSRAEWDQAADARAARMGERMAQRGEGEGPGHMRRRGRGHGAGPGGGRGMIARLDTNRDQVITREEFMAAVTERHTAMDGNGDGSVTAAERQAHRAERRGGRRGE